jgi:hypothetical protein
MIECLADYFNTINTEITNRLSGNLEGTLRAILVFFETKEKLYEFYNCPAFATRRDGARILTEEASPDEKDNIVRNATSSGSITLITKAFGRGTDFKSRD